MKSWEKAIEEVDNYKHFMPSGYSIIDPLIKPLCEFLTENGFITMHSCSGHVKASFSNAKYIMTPTGVKRRNIKFADKEPHIHNRWYILFVPKYPIKEIRQVMNRINKKYNYKLVLEKVNPIGELKNRWVIDEDIEFSFNDVQLYERHKTIYLEFKKHFESKASS